MIELRHPLWLALLGLVPALWWLHRLRDRGFDFPVAALFLWQPSKVAISQGMRIDTADPAWRRRALLAAVAALALAGPLLHSGQAPLTVWVDDSPSMFATESGTTRIELAAAEVVRRAQADAVSGFTLRSLGDPAVAIHVDSARELADKLTSWPVARQNLRPPPPVLMDKSQRHWLVSDGADRDLADWSANAPLAAIIEVGSKRNNAVIDAIAARANPDNARMMDLQFHIRYSGSIPGSRTLVISGTKNPGEQIVELAPGLPHVVTASAAMGQTITARLEPPDAMALDDSLVLTGDASAAIAVRIGADCPAALTDALDAIPGLEPSAAPARRAGLIVACASMSDLPPTDSPAVYFVAPETGVQRLPAPQWSAHAGPLRSIPVDNVSGAEIALGPGVAVTPLLSADGRTVIALHQSPGQSPAIYVGLAIDNTAWTPQTSFALLVARLAELVTERQLLDPVIEIRQEVTDEAISPRYRMRPNVVAIPAAESDREIAPWLICAALLLVLWDLVALIAGARGTAAPAAGTAK